MRGLFYMFAFVLSTSSANNAPSFRMPAPVGDLRLGMSQDDLLRLRPRVNSIAAAELFLDGKTTDLAKIDVSLAEDGYYEDFSELQQGFFNGAGYKVQGRRLTFIRLSGPGRIDFPSYAKLRAKLIEYCFLHWGPETESRLLLYPKKGPMGEPIGGFSKNREFALFWDFGDARAELQFSVDPIRARHQGGFSIKLRVAPFADDMRPWQVGPEDQRRAVYDQLGIAKLRREATKKPGRGAD